MLEKGRAFCFVFQEVQISIKNEIMDPNCTVFYIFILENGGWKENSWMIPKIKKIRLKINVKSWKISNNLVE